MNRARKRKKSIFFKLKYFILKLISNIKRDDVTILGASVSYYFLFSFVPFVIMLLNFISVSSIITTDNLISLSQVLPDSVDEMVISIIKETINSSNQAFLSIAAITSIYSASKGVGALMHAMNIALEIEENRSFIKTTAVAILLTIIFSISIITVLVALVFGNLITNKAIKLLNLPVNLESLIDITRTLFTLIFMILALTAIFKIGPAKSDDEMKNMTIKQVIPGAVFSSVAWIIVSRAFSFYVDNFSNFSKTYGSLGGIVALMLWFFITSIIVIVGTEVNIVLREMREANFQFVDIDLKDLKNL